MSDSVRIWLIDRLYPELSFEEFSDLAEEIAERIYETNRQTLIQDASQHTREGRKPNDIKVELENGETLNIKELYFASDDWLSIANCRCFIDRICYDFPSHRTIEAPDKTLFEIEEYDEELCGDEQAELKGKYKEAIQDEDGDWWAYRDWITENPDWDFKKVVLDALPKYIIKADLGTESQNSLGFTRSQAIQNIILHVRMYQRTS